MLDKVVAPDYVGCWKISTYIMRVHPMAQVYLRLYTRNGFPAAGS